MSIGIPPARPRNPTTGKTSRKRAKRRGCTVSVMRSSRARVSSRDDVIYRCDRGCRSNYVEETPQNEPAHGPRHSCEATGPKKDRQVGARQRTKAVSNGLATILREPPGIEIRR